MRGFMVPKPGAATHTHTSDPSCWTRLGGSFRRSWQAKVVALRASAKHLPQNLPSTGVLAKSKGSKHPKALGCQNTQMTLMCCGYRSWGEDCKSTTTTTKQKQRRSPRGWHLEGRPQQSQGVTVTSRPQHRRDSLANRSCYPAPTQVTVFQGVPSQCPRRMAWRLGMTASGQKAEDPEVR